MIEEAIKHIEDRIKFSDLRPEIVIKKESAEAVLSELETYKKIADEIEKMEREEYGKLGSYVRDNSTPEKERIAGGINFIRRLRKRLKERNEVEK